MRQRIWGIMVLFWFTVGTVTSHAGEYAADFLKIGVGARALSMGSAFSAVADDASAFYWNPAGLASPDRFRLHVEHVPMFGGLAQYNTANIVLSLHESLALSLSWIRLGVDDIPRYGTLQGSRFDRLTQKQYRSSGEPEGTFQDTEDAVMLSLSRTHYYDLYLGGGNSSFLVPFELSYGVTAKMIQHRLDQSTGTGQGVDAGVRLRLTSIEQVVTGEPDTWLALGAVFRDLTQTRLVWDTQSDHKDKLPRSLQAGVAASTVWSAMKTRVTISIDREFGLYDDMYFGGEVRLWHLVALRGGYMQDNFTAGAGLSLMGFSIDYAFVPHELDNTHRISGSFYF
jgi:hypothetical protein